MGEGVEMRELVCSPMTYVMAGVFGLFTMFGAVEVFANTDTSSVSFTPIVNFGDIFTSITTTIAPLVAGAIGLGLAIWGTLFIARLIKRAAR